MRPVLAAGAPCSALHHHVFRFNVQRDRTKDLHFPSLSLTHPGRRTSRIVGREQFVAFSLLAVVLTTASVGLKRFGTAAEVISSEQKCNYVSRHGLKGAGVGTHATQASSRAERAFL